ncbi:complement C4-A [Caerostris extrusa]|uniref:Complement C4-A n=1 Tax=Caerostris extrusa TaxID=172846 RepID=A0AAV4VFL3_CAEEX|nr:complement C4-A [Caerostris extrusa]
MRHQAKGFLKEKYCFDFRVIRQYIVGKTQRSIVKVYNYYNPDATCTVFYSPPNNSPILRTLCDGGVCQCAEGGCPPKKPFDIFDAFDDVSEKREKLRILLCDKYDYVWKGVASKEREKQDGFFKIPFEIQEVIKEGIEKRDLIEGETRHFLTRDYCAALTADETYLIMGKDGLKYQTKGHIWHRYILDQTSAVHHWTLIRLSPDKDLQRHFYRVINNLRKDGCLS